MNPMNVCTIITASHTAGARVLALTLREHHPAGTLTVLVLDDIAGRLDPAAEPFEIVTPQAIGCEQFDAMATRYSVIELATAVKPWLLETMLQRDDHAVYLDVDIEIVGDLTEIGVLAAEHGIVLTPHTLRPIPRDGRQPQEQALLRTGAYNLGFIAVGAGAIPMLRWWQERLETDCVVDVAAGLFVDQKWIDLVPSLWPQTLVLQDPGCNVAYWNLHERRLSTRADGVLLVNGQPGRFLHFSGFDPHRPELLSHYCDRFDLAARIDIAAATARYARLLLDSGYDETRAWPYRITRLGIGPDAESGPPGVNVVGYLDSIHGVGESARQLIGALGAAGSAVVPITIPGAGGLPAFEHPGAGGELEPVTLLVANADVTAEVAAGAGRDAMAGRRTVGFWMWETERFPEQLRPASDLLDEIWTGSSFAAGAISLALGRPVHHIPMPISLSSEPLPDRERLGLPDGFLFLFAFDFASVPRRKNPLGLVEAFRRAFPEPRVGAVLVLKSINGDRRPQERRELEHAIAGREDIVLLDRRLGSGEHETLVASCDCYVSLHRSEGLGLTIGEAMLLGKPVIATAYGGSNDIVTTTTAFPVRYELVPVGAGAAPYDPDDRWAEPDLDHAAELMRHVFTDRAGAARVAARGREHVIANHSPQAAGRVIAERLSHLGAGRPATGDQADGPDPAPARGDELPDAARARHETLMLLQREPPGARGARGLVRRLLRRISRGEAALRDEGDRALWWSIEASAADAAGRHDDLARAVEQHESLLTGLKGELVHLQAENAELRLLIGRRELERRRAHLSDGGASSTAAEAEEEEEAEG